MDKTGDMDDDFEIEFAPIQWQPLPVFRRPHSSQRFQQHERTTNSSRSRKIGSSQDVRLIWALHTFKALREQPKVHSRLSPATTEPTTSSLTSPILSKWMKGSEEL